MKNKISFLISLGLLLAAALHSPSHAQRYFSGFEWNISQSNEEQSQFIDSTSFLGFGMDFAKFHGDHTTFGVFLGWHVFDEETGETSVFDNGAITGTQFRYINAFPLMLSAHFFIGEDNTFRPYLAIGAGVYYVKTRVDISLYRIEESDWKPGVMPELGLMIPIDYDVELLFGARYNYGYTTDQDTPDLSYFSAVIGIANTR